jgi:hypothetical protein
MWGLGWTTWHCGRIFSENFGFLCQSLFISSSGSGTTDSGSKESVKSTRIRTIIFISSNLPMLAKMCVWSPEYNAGIVTTATRHSFLWKYNMCICLFFQWFSGIGRVRKIQNLGPRDGRTFTQYPSIFNQKLPPDWNHNPASALKRRGVLIS